MTHTLHRLGNPDNLRDDFVVLAMSAKGINEEGSHIMMRAFMEFAFELDPINAGDMKTGNIYTHSRQEILDGIQDVSIVHAVFTDEAKVSMLLERVREAELGISVVVTGLFGRVRECALKGGTRQHTVECSSGIWGRTDRLPGSRVMQVTTMCGHAMISAAVVERQAREVRLRRKTGEEASIYLAKACVCGVFNPVRAARMLELLAAENESAPRVEAGQTVAL